MPVLQRSRRKTIPQGQQSASAGGRELIYWRFIWRNAIALRFRGRKTLTVDFNLGLKPQRFVFRGASWGAAAEPAEGGGAAGMRLRSLSTPRLRSRRPPRRALKIWARLEGFGPFECARNSRSRSSQGESVGEGGKPLPPASATDDWQSCHWHSEVLRRRPGGGGCLPLPWLSRPEFLSKDCSEAVVSDAQQPAPLMQDTSLKACSPPLWQRDNAGDIKRYYCKCTLSARPLTVWVERLPSLPGCHQRPTNSYFSDGRAICIKSCGRQGPQPGGRRKAQGILGMEGKMGWRGVGTR